MLKHCNNEDCPLGYANKLRKFNIITPTGNNATLAGNYVDHTYYEEAKNEFLIRVQTIHLKYRSNPTE